MTPGDKVALRAKVDGEADEAFAAAPTKLAAALDDAFAVIPVASTMPPKVPPQRGSKPGPRPDPVPPSLEGEVLLAVNFRSLADIKNNFVGFTDQAAPPNLDSIQYVPLDSEGYPGQSAARFWAAYNQGKVRGNERIVSFFKLFEPKLRAFGNGYTHLVLEYLLRVGEDVDAAMTQDGAKILGLTGMYDVDAPHVELPNPRWNPFATWEARLWHGKLTPQGYPLACYAYLTRDPRNGLSATAGKYGGSGNPYGPLMTTGYLIPGKLHRIRQEVGLNTVKNKALLAPVAQFPARLPGQTDNEYYDICTPIRVAQFNEMLENCNTDGLLRISLDGKVVGEWDTMGYRGLDGVRIFGVFVNIYQGGRGDPVTGAGYPRAPEHYDLGRMRVFVPATQPAGDPPVGGALSTLIVGMKAGEWAELLSTNIDEVIAVGTPGDAGNRIVYANSAARDGVRRRFLFVGSDHAAKDNTEAARALVTFTDASSSWSRMFTVNPTKPTVGMGSHAYQHTAVDPLPGDVWLAAVVGEGEGDAEHAVAHIYKSVGGTAPFQIATTCPESFNQIAATPALSWWRGPFAGSAGKGVLVVYGGPFGSIHVFDPYAVGGGKWNHSSYNHIPGAIRNVMAYSGVYNCAVFGFGRKFARLNADRTVTQMPEAPIQISVWDGANFVGDGAGKMLAFGFGELWLLDPSGTGKWTQLPAPTVQIVEPDSHLSLISADCYDLGAAVYVDFVGQRSPKCRMWVRKAA